MEISFRPARPEDALPAASLLFATAPSYFVYVFGVGKGERRALDFAAHAFCAEEGPLSHVYATVASGGSDVLGLALGYSIREKPAIERATLGVSLRGFSLAEWFRFVKHGLDARKLLGAVPEAGWYLAQVAVVPAARGTGLGRRLLGEALTRAAAARHRLCMLHVCVSNERARHVYQKAGFRVVAELRDEPLERRTGLDGQIAMVRDLKNEEQPRSSPLGCG